MNKKTALKIKKARQSEMNRTIQNITFLLDVNTHEWKRGLTLEQLRGLSVGFYKCQHFDEAIADLVELGCVAVREELYFLG